ncbi:metalloprotease PmbA [Enterobacteriaceae endosymbiont of Plateumaris pusilla]|uniref:metalloprotease PmbA n=1 Tax=Enterobacteriaceae endosymbiont of Plateumaris pusilla TaxID=2675795 RepID=UPI0014499221|nr:metalloprotease PmbA [Enterobacteriaceae endosymbiont of Plateumaris pusilla]QJC29727.1 metalloprotease PmbA [Enterobacteriaceae endosymbiont of Plateumaris pusilla]
MEIFSTIIEERNILESKMLDFTILAKKEIKNFEITIKKIIGFNTHIRYGMIKISEFYKNESFFINVYKNYQKGYAETNNLSINNIKNTINYAVNLSNYTSYDICLGLPKYKLLISDNIDLNLFHISKINKTKCILLLKESEEIALNMDKRIITSNGGDFNSFAVIHIFANSLGILQSYISTYYSLYLSVIAKENNKMECNYSYSISRSIIDLYPAEKLGKDSAQKSLNKLGSCKIKTQKSPIIFSSEIAFSLFKHLAELINGYHIYQKLTFLFNSLNKMIFPEWLNIIEDPHVLKGLGSRPFDNEGVRTKKTMIVKNGILKKWLLNNYTANKLNIENNGHAGGIYNWYINSKNYINYNTLIKKMNKGLIVTELMSDGINSITGDYSRGVCGFWVENGKIKFPVSEITISSNLKKIWLSILEISNDIEKKNSIQCGSILISEMTISGF